MEKSNIIIIIILFTAKHKNQREDLPSDIIV